MNRTERYSPIVAVSGPAIAPVLAGFFDLKPLSLCDLAIAAAGGIVVFAAIEVQKRL